MVGIVVCSGPRAGHWVAPFGGREGRLATNPIAFALPVQGGPLLLDAAFLVPRTRATSFQALAARESRALARHGYTLTFSGPWPPYSFVQD